MRVRPNLERNSPFVPEKIAETSETQIFYTSFFRSFAAFDMTKHNRGNTPQSLRQAYIS